MTAISLPKFIRGLPVLAAIFGLVALVGCDLLGNTGNATVRVLLTDDPFPFEMVESANVTIERVELVSESEGVINVTAEWSEPQDFNLLDLRDGVTALLGEIEIPEGMYHQVRLVVSEEASVVMKEEFGGEVYNLTVPSGTETGVKIPLESLDVESGSYITLTLDFEVDESFVVLGDASTAAGILGFNFKPVVTLLDVELDAVVEESTEE